LLLDSVYTTCAVRSQCYECCGLAGFKLLGVLSDTYVLIIRFKIVFLASNSSFNHAFISFRSFDCQRVSDEKSLLFQSRYINSFSASWF